MDLHGKSGSDRDTAEKVSDWSAGRAAGCRIPLQGRLELEGVNGYHPPSGTGGADGGQLDRRRNAPIGGERQVFDDHIDRLDPVGSSRLDSVNVRKREGA
jgi:hypothetical protein